MSARGFDPRALKPAQACEQGFEFRPVMPDGTPMDGTITVRGPRSEAVRAHAAQQYELAQQRSLAARRAGKPVAPMSLDELEASTVDLAVVYTIAWSGFVDGDQPMPCTPATAREVYAEHGWLREQVIEEAQRLGNFIRASLPSCTNTPAPSSA